MYPNFVRIKIINTNYFYTSMPLVHIRTFDATRIVMHIGKPENIIFFNFNSLEIIW